MKHSRGLYYYPNPLNKTFRTYVKKEQGVFFFRLWSSEDPQLWEQHEWIPYDAIQKAAKMYAGDRFDPTQAYDLDLARALVKEDEQEKARKKR